MRTHLRWENAGMHLSTPGLSLTACIAALFLLAFAGSSAQTRTPLRPDTRADFVLVEKARHSLTLFSHGRALRTYKVALGHGGLAHKRREGDGLTPEGRYRIDRRNARSRFHRALHISYPSARDIAAARARGERPGGDIMIHGLPNGSGWLGAEHRMMDWTNGCIAVTDEEIEEIWRAVPDGTAVEIRK
jgi:murein L,D-transpeptidase YafK